MTDLDRYQTRATESREPHIFVSAPAGSGKTRVLIERVVWLVSEGHCRQDEILVVTFARSAAQEIRDRLVARGLSDVTAQTFHAWAYGFLRSIHTIPFRLIKEHEKAKLIKKIFLAHYGSNAHRSICGLIKDRNWSVPFLVRQVSVVIDQLRNFNIEPTEIGEYMSSNRDPFEILCVQVWEAYERLLEKHAAYDFPLLVSKSLELLRVKTGQRTRKNYRHVLIDEVQDANTKELSLLFSLVTKQTGVTWVGDRRQALYGWRGATPFLAKAKEYHLRYNYRSDASIIRVVNSFNNSNKGSDTILAHKKHEIRPRLLIHERYKEPMIVNQLMGELKTSGYKCEDVLILARARALLGRFFFSNDYKPMLRTVHGAKGLEARAVILLGCNEERFGFPLIQREEQHKILARFTQYDRDREERNIFYVAMTRARERLILLQSQNQPSPFTDKISRRLMSRAIITK